MQTDFDYSYHQPSPDGVRAALPVMFADSVPQSLLDVGCGTGTWIRAALDLGIDDVLGVDGDELASNQLLFPRGKYRRQNLEHSFDLGRKFEIAICLEVGEHLEEEYARVLVTSLVQHADLVYFSAACPGQAGPGHINCQWPAYWQRMFNAEGYVCDDSVRWRLWDLTALEFWYRQNLFLARRAPERAGREPRIRPVIHPQMLELGNGCPVDDLRSRWRNSIEAGSQSVGWYLSTTARAFSHKLARKISSRQPNSLNGNQ